MFWPCACGRCLLPPGGTNPNPEAPTTTPLVSEPGCVAGNRTGPRFSLGSRLLDCSTLDRKSPKSNWADAIIRWHRTTQRTIKTLCTETILYVFFLFLAFGATLAVKTSAGKICKETSRNRDVGKYNKYYLLRCVRVQQVVVFVTGTNGDEWSCVLYGRRGVQQVLYCDSGALVYGIYIKYINLQKCTKTINK